MGKKCRMPQEYASNPLILFTKITVGRIGLIGLIRKTETTKKLGYRKFDEAREFARKLRLPNKRAWENWSKSGFRPDDIPSSPHQTYRTLGWLGYKDWLTKNDN